MYDMCGRYIPSVGWTFGRELSKFGVRGSLSLYYIRHLMKSRINKIKQEEYYEKIMHFL